jgi:integrase
MNPATGESLTGRRRARRSRPARKKDMGAEAIGMVGVHPHDLRHTAASLAIASGADVKVIQGRMPPASSPDKGGR